MSLGMNVPNQGGCLAHCAGCVLLITFRKYGRLPYSRAPYSVLYIDCPSSAEYDILSAKKEALAKPPLEHIFGSNFKILWGRCPWLPA